MLKKSLSTLVIGIVILFVTNTSMAIPETVYQIEIIVFKQPPASNKTSENFNQEHLSPIHTNNVHRLSLDNASASQDILPYTLLPASELKLDKEEKSLRARQYSILLHAAWRQPLSDNSRAKPVLLMAGKGYNDDNQVVVEIPKDTQPAPSDSLTGRVSFWELEGTVGTTLNTYYFVTPHLHFTEVSPTSKTTYEIKQTQRARSNELHYFDHPYFGAIVQITPVKG